MDWALPSMDFRGGMIPLAVSTVLRVGWLKESGGVWDRMEIESFIHDKAREGKRLTRSNE